MTMAEDEMNSVQQKITVALCAGIVAKAALEFINYCPDMGALLTRALHEKVGLLLMAVEGKDVSNRRRMED